MGSRVHRCSALLVAWLLAWQSWGFAVDALLQAPAASCCCSHKSESKVCHCRVCTHAREAASGEPRMKECSSPSQQTLVAAARPLLPPPAAVPWTRPTPPLPAERIARPPLEPPLEVLTPPPLGASQGS